MADTTEINTESPTDTKNTGITKGVSSSSVKQNRKAANSKVSAATLKALREHAFRPGHSGNPTGRPKGFSGAIRSTTGEGKELIETALQFLRDKKARRGDRMAALEWLADRGWGKAVAFSADVSEGNSLRDLAKEVVRLEMKADTKTPTPPSKPL